MNEIVYEAPLVNVVSYDSRMNEKERRAAYEYILKLNEVRKINKPVSIRLSTTGGYVVNIGNIVDMSPKEVARKFKESLMNGDATAKAFNEILCSINND